MFNNYIQVGCVLLCMNAWEINTEALSISMHTKQTNTLLQLDEQLNFVGYVVRPFYRTMPCGLLWWCRCVEGLCSVPSLLWDMHTQSTTGSRVILFNIGLLILNYVRAALQIIFTLECALFTDGLSRWNVFSFVQLEWVRGCCHDCVLERHMSIRKQVYRIRVLIITTKS
jgi:hypothetical protein